MVFCYCLLPWPPGWTLTPYIIIRSPPGLLPPEDVQVRTQSIRWSHNSDVIKLRKSAPPFAYAKWYSFYRAVLCKFSPLFRVWEIAICSFILHVSGFNILGILINDSNTCYGFSSSILSDTLLKEEEGAHFLFSVWDARRNWRSLTSFQAYWVMLGLLFSQ